MLRLVPHVFYLFTGKSDAALRDAANSYLAWLDEQTSPAFASGSATDADLSDLAWTAGVARGHFENRNAVVFRDTRSLRDGLKQIADSTDEPYAQRASKVAFAFTGQGNQWVGMGELLYRTEPVFRAVLDRCDRLIREERGSSLLDVMFGRPGAAGDLDEPRWTQPAIYALECGLTALWDSVGISPDVVIEIGPHPILGPLVSLNWPSGNGSVELPVVLQSLLRPSFDGSEPERADAFAYAVAGAYKSGLPVDFIGLFAGEERRRISVPGYPFQRRRYWVEGTQRQRSADAHPLLGEKHESPRGEVMYETEMFPSDPSWLGDHQVFGRVVMPGAVYDAMAATVPQIEDAAGTAVEELQLHNPLVYPAYDADSESEEPGPRLQLVIDAPKDDYSRSFEVFSKGEGGEDWLLHAEGQLSPDAGQPSIGEKIDLDTLKAKRTGVGAGPAGLRAYSG